MSLARDFPTLNFAFGRPPKVPDASHNHVTTRGSKVSQGRVLGRLGEFNVLRANFSTAPSVKNQYAVQARGELLIGVQPLEFNVGTLYLLNDFNLNFPFDASFSPIGRLGPIEDGINAVPYDANGFTGALDVSWLELTSGAVPLSSLTGNVARVTLEFQLNTAAPDDLTFYASRVTFLKAARGLVHEIPAGIPIAELEEPVFLFKVPVGAAAGMQFAKTVTYGLNPGPAFGDGGPDFAGFRQNILAFQLLGSNGFNTVDIIPESFSFRVEIV